MQFAKKHSESSFSSASTISVKQGSATNASTMIKKQKKRRMLGKLGERLDDDLYTRGPYHYSKQYYKSYIKMANRGNFQRVQKSRQAFIPDYKVKEKTHKDRFQSYLERLRFEEQQTGCNIIKAMANEVKQGTLGDPLEFIMKNQEIAKQKQAQPHELQQQKHQKQLSE